MKIFGVTLNVLAVVLVVLMVAVTVYGCVLIIKPRNQVDVEAFRAIAEYAYLEGQKDALEGDIRIEKKDGVWVWIKSPWDSEE